MNSLRVIGAVLTAFLLTSCGTTHQAIPYRPLKRGQWEYSLVFHYDINGLTTPTLLPDFNAYVGTGKNINVGAGLEFPFLVTHLSPVQYFPAGHDDYWTASFHLNRVYAANSNPFVELCGSDVANSPDASQSLTLGLGYGDYIKPGILFLPAAGIGHGNMSTILKASVAYKKWGLSWQHYTGQTKRMLRPFREDIVSENRRLYAFARNDVARSSVDSYPNSGSVRSLQFTLKDSTQVRFDPVVYGAEEGALRYLYKYGDAFCARQGYQWLSVKEIPAGTPPGKPWFAYDQVMANPSALANLIMHADSVEIWEYPRDLVRKIDAIRTWKSDHSIGVVFTDKFR